MFLLALVLRPCLENNVLPNICTLSGLSVLDAGILLEEDLPEDLRDKARFSVDANTDSRERKEDAPDDNVVLEELLPNIELLFICSVYARMRSGEGGPSIAGSKESAEDAFSLKEWDFSSCSLRCGFFIDDDFEYIGGYALLPAPSPNIVVIGMGRTWFDELTSQLGCKLL